MKITRIFAVVLILFTAYLGYFIYSSEKEGSEHPFRFGLDLDGGTHLTYRADVSAIESSEVDGAMDSLRKTIERRINVFGVSEPIIQVEEGGAFASDEYDHRLIVELPGVTDVTEAIDAIGRTPILEFRLAGDSLEPLESLNASSTVEEYLTAINSAYIPTGLGGGQLEKAQLVFDQTNGQPVITIQFDNEGQKLFQELTRDNVGKVMAIFLDGQIISAPVIRQEILGGTAQITGQFTGDEAKKLVQDLNFGALPVPVELIGTQSIDASLGSNTLNAGVIAFIWAFGVIFAFLVLWYRLPGLIAVISLVSYAVIMMFLFKFIPVTLTSSGLAGFILSIGMAVDANILIFERMKEELKERNHIRESIREGFSRAWLSIRDGNLSSIISAAVLFWLSGTSLVKGFALVFGLGVIVSMISAIIISRTLLLAVSPEITKPWSRFLFGNGFSRNKK